MSWQSCCVSQHRRKEESEGKHPPQSYEIELLTFRVSITAVAGSRDAVVTRRCACLWSPPEPGMGRQCFVNPCERPCPCQLPRPWCPLLPSLPVPYFDSRGARAVPVRGCARVQPLKPCKGFARVVPTQPDPSPVPVAARAFSCPFVASGSWRSGYVPRVS